MNEPKLGIEVLRERITVASADGKIPDDALVAVANLLESRWPGRFACNAMSEPALLAALMEDAGAVKVGVYRERGDMSGRICIEGSSGWMASIADDTKVYDFWLLSIPEDTP